MMKQMRPVAVASLVGLMLAGPAWSAVFVTVGEPKASTAAHGQRVEQELKLASEVANYTLAWDYNRLAEKPEEINSGQWAWTVGYVPLGMNEPSMPNWYYQGFFNWHFDEESIYNRPPETRVVRAGGDDGMIEIKWETPAATASIRFAMTTGSDKLLMFGHYEPKRPMERSYVTLSCYPSFFPEPRERAVTTSLGTRRPGETIDLDLARERWVLYEDTSEGREGSGSAGLLVGTPDAFSSITIPVGAYGIVTTLELDPEKRDFAVALYDFPSMPDYREAREYFGRSADQEAEALGRAAAGDLEQPLPVLPHDEERLARILEEGERMFARPAELWRPDAERLSFGWARDVPGEAIKTVLFAPRWYAWETMELGRRLPMEVQHLYFDQRDALSNTKSWPYRNATGIGPIPYGVAARKAASLAADDSAELFVCASVDGRAIPGVARAGIAKQVAAGKALILSGPGWVREGWDQALFEEEAPEIAEGILAGLDWQSIPGLGEEEAGRLGSDPPVRVFGHGEGLVIWLSINTNHFGALSPRNEATEGIMTAMDRFLGIAARAALAGVGREPQCKVLLLSEQVADRRLPVRIEPAPPAGSTLQVRIQDDLERVIEERELELPLAGGAIALPAMQPSRQWYVDALVKNGEGRCLGFGFAALAPGEGPVVGDIAVSPARLTHEASVPWVQQQGGEVSFETTVTDAPGGARLGWEVRDVFGRVLGTTETDAPANGQAARVTLTLNTPVTVCHMVEVTLRAGEEVLDFERQRFTMQVPYPYEDFTGLMWTTCGGMPLIRMTDRYCYEWGAEMCDPANTLRRSDESAARDYALTSRSGLRMVPYVTRISGEGDDQGHRKPCLHDPAYIAEQEEYLTINGRQGAPYQPAAYTLGDENYLTRRQSEVCYRPESIAAFKGWLADKYATIAGLNAEWGTDYASFEAVETPPKLAEAAASGRFVPWMEHKAFMDEAFIEAHEMCAGWLRGQDPGGKVGWDGILSYHFGSGYEFAGYTANLELNQTYLGQRLQGEAVRSFKRTDALTGKWGNRVADNEAGWKAFPWHCLMLGDKSVWWWTSWGCDYTPFNPDLSQNDFGKWFFESLREATAGPGKLLLHGERQDHQVAMLYSKRDMLAAALAGELMEGAPFASENGFLRQQEAIFLAITDLGVEFSFISHADLEQGRLEPARTPLLVLSLASSLSDAEVEAVRAYVEAGGTLLVDGRAGLMNENGRPRESRPLDELLGVSSAAGMEGFKQPAATGTVTTSGALPGVVQEATVDLDEFDAAVLEPTIEVDRGTALAEVDGAPVLIANRVGKGVAVTLNISMHDLTSSRMTEEAKPRRDLLAAVLAGAGLRAPCELRRADGSWPLCVRQAVFQDGAARYLMLQQDIILPGLPDQQAQLTLPEAAVVYDLRAGKRIGKVREWEVTLSREQPLIFSLMPYEVTAVSLQAGTAARGENTPVQVAVTAGDGEPGYHVVRLNVYAPGSEAPHRQYSQNIGCEGGKGSGSIPFALNDPTGQWRLEVRDVASGLAAEARISLK